MEQDRKGEETCEICKGTGTVATYWTNPETHQWEPDGEDDCVCQLPDEYDETPEE